MHMYLLLFICDLFYCVNALAGCYTLDFVLRRAKSTCVVACVTNGRHQADSCEGHEQFQHLKHMLTKNDSGILVGHIDISDKWSDGTSIIEGNETIGVGDLVLFQKVHRDRSDVIPTPYPKSLVPFVYRHGKGTTQLIDFINGGCNTYFSNTGALSKQGVHREEIRKSKFFVKNISSVQSKHVFFQKCSENKEFCYSDRDFQPHGHIPRLPECEKIDLPSRDAFFHKYLKISKPVLFKNVLKDWPAFTKWSNDYLRKKYGKHEVRFQLTPQGEYERIEPRNSWENHEKFKIPQSHVDHMPTPDLVLVRPASEIRNFSFFMDILEGVSNRSISNLSVYLEYASIPEYLPELEEDIRERMLFNGLLKREMLNLWLSDGRTLGKIHFDAHDNFLCQISGKKQVILFDPHNNYQLYEGHIPEAIMSYNFTSKSFQRRELLDATVHVWSPVDITNPDYDRFPLFGETYPMNCTLEEGDVLYLPAFWWHEVQSFPNTTAGRNLAINFWYNPFLTRDYPCPECQLDVNPDYRHLL